MMKKTLAMLLLSALCVTFLTACDFSGGLIGELLAEQNQNNVDVDPIVDALGTADVIIDPLPPVEIETIDGWETEPPVEYTTESSLLPASSFPSFHPSFLPLASFFPSLLSSFISSLFVL